MSIKIMSWVLDQSPYLGKQRLVHLVLADHANDEGVCWPSQVTIARRAGCSVEHVRLTIKDMVTDGYVEIIKGSTRQGEANRYLLKSPNHMGTNTVGVPKSTGEGPQVDGTTSPNTPPSNRKEPSKESNTYRCTYCRAKVTEGKKHNCSAMNMTF